MASERYPPARATLRDLPLFDQIVRYRPGVTERVFTNPCAPDYACYPCPKPLDLQRRFASVVQAGCTTDLGLDSGEILFTPGSTVAIDLVMRAYCDPGRDILCAAHPTFPVIRHYARAYGIELHEAPLGGRDLNELDVDGLTSRPCSLTYLCRPTWPLGALTPLEQIAAVCRRTRGLVLIDEAYIEFSGAESAAALLADFDNVLVARTLSKAWGLAGLRMGALIGPSSLLHPVQLLLDPFGVNSAAQAALAERLDRASWMRTAVEMICAERDRLTRELPAVPGVGRVYRSYANFLCVTVREAPRVIARALAEDLLMTDISRFVSDTIRISISHREENTRVLALLAEQAARPAALAAPAS